VEAEVVLKKVIEQAHIPGLRARRGRGGAEGRAIYTPCLPKKQCRVCDGRLNARFGKAADKNAKYLHQAEEAGRAAVHAIRAGLEDKAAALAARACGFAKLAGITAAPEQAVA
jgi:hypothetical protein